MSAVNKSKEEKRKELIKLYGVIQLNGRDIPKTKPDPITGEQKPNKIFMTKIEKEMYDKYIDNKEIESKDKIYGEFVKIFG
jgi:hypothetical protein